MSLRRMRELQSFEDKSMKIVQFLEEKSPNFITKVEACIYLREIDLLYHEGMETSNLFSLYSLVKSKVESVISRFNLGYTESEDDDFYELVHDREEEFNEVKLSKLVERFNDPVLFSREIMRKMLIQSRKPVYGKFSLEFLLQFNSVDSVGISLLLDEIETKFNKFFGEFSRNIKLLIFKNDERSITINIIENV